MSIVPFRGQVLFASVILLLLGLGSVPAFAEEDPPLEQSAEVSDGETVVLTDTQRELNNEAIMAMRQSPPDVEKALSLLNAALVAGPGANLLYVTLGRALELAGRCDEALEALEKAREAPPVEGISAEQIEIRVRTYRDNLWENCPARLMVVCKDPDIELYSEDISLLRCNTVAEVKPGTYGVIATQGELAVSLEFVLRGMEESTVTIDMSGASEALRLARARGERFDKRPGALGSRRFQVDFAMPTGIYAFDTRAGHNHRGVMTGGAWQMVYNHPMGRGRGVQSLFNLGYDRGRTFSVSSTGGGSGPDDRGGFESINFVGEFRTWFRRLVLGFFVDYRMQEVSLGNRDSSSSSLLAGPTFSHGRSVTVAGRDAHLLWTVRWIPLFDGHFGTMGISSQLVMRRLLFRINYGPLTGGDSGDEIDTGGFLTFDLGMRLPSIFDLD